MEPIDDFDSLLKGAAGRYNMDPLTEQSVSKILDERLAASSSKLTSEFITEILLVLGALASSILFLSMNIFLKEGKKPEVLMMTNVIYLAGIVYLLTCLFMFIRLMRLSLLQKDTHIKSYLTKLYERTRRTLNIYLWSSTITWTLVLGVLFTLLQMSWYWMLPATVLSGIGGYYLNLWYIRKRFGKQVDEIKMLMTEFC
ncbi:hypothetical protein SAMN05428949_4499 [Chitinophaga sp. YR627]|uniref:hypothetical protein n=1 Tax=Chitinophaga sp. YR627 TaxID=1881041 RepID=UPI0008E9CA51|nr:hypothetical protein [Chitinophaga sp. YR627]SFO21487.1 hypothetical protein SAMN05428949_4499 [Chitinophaga sp. YR627]